MKNDFRATVAAISTPPGKGGVALIRLSGPDALAISGRVFFSRSGKDLAAYPPRTSVRGDLRDAKGTVDDGMAVYFRAPHSYTGEDTVEFTCHGGILVTRTVLEALIEAGAEPAGPGEFTRRAFINGKLSLTDAEGIGILLDAAGREGMTLGGTEARNRLTEALEGIRAELVGVMSSLFARIDYPDEDLGEYGDKEIAQAIGAALARTDTLLATYDTGRAVVEGIPTVLVGKPNAGKSSLYNLLVGTDAAIVTSVAGTTRDVLEKTVPCGRVLLRLSDTAGVRETDDPVEKIGVERTRRALAEADLVLAVFDGSAAPEKEDAALAEEILASGKSAVAVLMKSDLGTDPATYALAGRFATRVSLSAVTGEGLDDLKGTIGKMFADEKILPGRDPILSSARQFAALTRAKDALTDAKDALTRGIPADAVASEIERAIAAVGEVDGKAVTDEVVSGIFSKFCVGK